MLREAAHQEPVPESHWCVNTILSFSNEPQWLLNMYVPKCLLRDEAELRHAFQQWCAANESGVDLIKVSMCIHINDEHRRNRGAALPAWYLQSSGKLLFGDFE